MSKRLSMPFISRPLVIVPSYEIPQTVKNKRRLFLPEHDDTLLNFDQGAEKTQKISDRGKYAEAFFKVNDVTDMDFESEDYLL